MDDARQKEIARAIRGLRGKTARDRAAIEAGIGVRTLATWETGKAIPSHEKLAKYTAAFGVDPDTVVPPAWREEDNSDERDRLAEALEHLATSVEEISARVAALDARL